ncbi:hypothetical protein AG0111_0g7834 [Alternaria gaisen]|uniref:Uncharacterized protein n=1 Tax=Alternaria gaisen TaxID=167740 RepID=A0ACB6FJ62_9PLEO|nr:hypothetical protein AG0111_0g7834 [Alternaria gaisen]
MEALSGAASGIAVVSLTIQLIQSIALIREFIKDVKGASKELQRLVGKLELLKALLEDARKVLEQQSSLQKMHFPTPSMAVFRCLQDCEKSIEPLVDIVKKLSLPQSQSSSSTARLKNEIKLGLKAKDISTLETRIQHDIDLLTNSLSINQSGILTNLLPVILRNQETMLNNNNAPFVASVKCSDLGIPATTLDTASSFAPSHTRYSQQTILVRSAFERLRLYRRKVIRYQDQRIEDSEGNVKSYKRDILWTANEVSTAWAFLGFGMTFTQQQPYGSIIPGLRTYPVIKFDQEIFEIMREGSVEQLQRRISSGALHPFSRGTAGDYSLLHYAAVYHRPDICRLILGYGVKPEVTSHHQSPLSMALTSYSSRTSPANAIDTYRCFLDDDDLVDELKRSDGYHLGDDRSSSFTADEAQWLWQKSSELSVGEDLRSNQRVIIRRFWSITAHTDYGLHLKLQLPIVQMDKDILSDIQYGSCQILQDLFWICNDVMQSYILGAWFLQWLTSLHLDPEICVASELANLEKWISLDEKRIVFERDWEQKWILGFEWVFDHEAPGYSLVSQYTNLVVEYYWGTRWPFHESWYARNRKWSDRSAHFSRGMAAKERKERARLGQKQPRSRMPGAWKW